MSQSYSTDYLFETQSNSTKSSIVLESFLIWLPSTSIVVRNLPKLQPFNKYSGYY